MLVFFLYLFIPFEELFILEIVLVVFFSILMSLQALDLVVNKLNFQK